MRALPQNQSDQHLDNLSSTPIRIALQSRAYRDEQSCAPCESTLQQGESTFVFHTPSDPAYTQNNFTNTTFLHHPTEMSLHESSRSVRASFYVCASHWHDHWNLGSSRRTATTKLTNSSTLRAPLTAADRTTGSIVQLYYPFNLRLRLIVQGLIVQVELSGCEVRTVRHYTRRRAGRRRPPSPLRAPVDPGSGGCQLVFARVFARTFWCAFSIKLFMSKFVPKPVPSSAAPLLRPD